MLCLRQRALARTGERPALARISFCLPAFTIFGNETLPLYQTAQEQAIALARGSRSGALFTGKAHDKGTALPRSRTFSANGSAVRLDDSPRDVQAQSQPLDTTHRVGPREASKDALQVAA